MPSNQTRPHLERVLLVAGMPNAGKSNLLRGMFVDPRFGTNGAIPTDAKIKLVALSRERCLSIRCTSPHEMGESIEHFFEKIDRAMERAWGRFWRFNFACAVQPRETDITPSIIDICRAMQKRFCPERIRIAQIDPRQDELPGNLMVRSEIDKLRRMSVEVMTLDVHGSPARERMSNGLLLADFFDFV